MSELTERIRRELATATRAPWAVKMDGDGDDDDTWEFPIGIEPAITYAEFASDGNADAALIVTLRNHASVLLEVVERAEQVADLAFARADLDVLGKAIGMLCGAVIVLREVNDAT